MFQIPNGPELIVILALALLVFGPKRLPEIGKSIGKGLRELRKASREITDAFDFSENLSLNDEDISPAKNNSDHVPELESHVDTPKENEHNADDSEHHAVSGLADHSVSDSSTVRSEEAAGDRQIDG